VKADALLKMSAAKTSHIERSGTMFLKFVQPPPPPEATPNEEKLTAAEIVDLAKARNIDLVAQQPLHCYCGRCLHWLFAEYDENHPMLGICTAVLPFIGADGVAVWPRTGWSFKCAHHKECHSLDVERRRLLRLFHAKTREEAKTTKSTKKKRN